MCDEKKQYGIRCRTNKSEKSEKSSRKRNEKGLKYESGSSRDLTESGSETLEIRSQRERRE
jgi:hypothetical protein